MKNPIAVFILTLFIFSSCLQNSKDNKKEKGDDKPITKPEIIDSSCYRAFDSTIFITTAEPGFPTTEFTLMFYDLSRKPLGIILGVSPGEYDPKYYKSIVEKVKIIDDSISLSYKIYNFFASPFTKENYKSFRSDTVGWLSDGTDIFLNGKIKGDALILVCSSENNYGIYECFRDTLKFVKE